MIGFVIPILQMKNLRHLVAQMVYCLPAIQETQVQSLGLDDPREKELATHSSMENPMDSGAWQARVSGV